MNRELCLVICFFVGVLVFYLLKQSCGCKSTVVEGAFINLTHWVGACGKDHDGTPQCLGVNHAGCHSDNCSGWT